MCGNHRVAVIFSAIILLGFTIINFYVLRFRGNELNWADFGAIGTAFAVAGAYDYSIDAPFAYGTILIVIYCYAIYCVMKQHFIRTRKNVIFSIACVGVICIILGISIPKITPEHFTGAGSNQNGFFVNFICRMKSATVEEPDNYNRDIIINLFEKNYNKIEEEIEKDNYPHLIIIMNESFSDLSVVGMSEENTEITPFFKSLSKNTIRGYALCSAFGGGTCNSEYELLTGNSMGFFPEGTFPYQQYIKTKQWSIVEELEKIGYTSIGTHPEAGTNWMRESVYPLVGFDNNYFIDNYPQQKLCRTHVSDQEMYEQIVSWYENKEPNKNFFLFGVTMQNHSPYNFENFKNTVELKGYSQSYPETEQYLSLLNHSDKALEYLISYFEEQEEEVVVLFFGDHLPRIEEEFYQEIMQANATSLEEEIKKYKVPFVIWANYDIEEEYVECTSLNFLSNYLYKAMGLELPLYNQFLEDVQEVIPAMNVLGYYSKAKEAFVTYDQAEGAEAEILEKYEILQYNSLFDGNNRSEVFFKIN